MALTPGTRLGVYEVIASIGVGGMGEVYRATDTTLGRQVAIKILPDAFAADPERMARFEREAKTLASLNHPNIAAIYAVEKSAPSTGSGHAVMPALVMELVEGDDLSRRLAHGAIPIDEALPIAKQVTEALEAAHEQGIIHRDLKPANIKVRSDGAVKVLDFGLAKAMEPVGAMSPSVSMSPTITTPAMTQAGMILGTAAYMAPEQARGKTVDKRADIWAFGAVLYEMLTGRRAFDADDVSLTMARVLEREVDFDALPPAVPARVHQTLRMCLRKDSKQRIGDIRDVRLALEGAFETAAPQLTSSASSSTPRTRLAWMAALGVAVLGIIALAIPTVRHLRETPPPTPPETRLEIATPPTADPTSFALSPDGRRLVFVASGDGPSRLWLRSLDRVTAQPLAGTDGAVRPFWSPDSRSVAFFANGTLKRLDIGSGPPQTLATGLAGGGSWSPDGVILFSPGAGAPPLFRVPASGGEAVAVTTLAAGQTFHTSPQFLPGGRRFLFHVMGAENAAGIYLGSLDAPDTQRLTAAETAGAYVPPGWLLFVRQGTLVARRFDIARGLTGDPVSVADPVGVAFPPPRGAFSVSAMGAIAYRAPGGTARQLTWFDRSGQVLGTLGARDEHALWEPALSPDGRRVAVSRVVQNNADVWLIDAARTTRFTFEAGNDNYPLWSPDGSRIVFSAVRASTLDLYEKPSSGAGRETLLVESTQPKAATSWSRDGRFLLYNSVDRTTNFDVWVRPLQGDAKPWAFLHTNVNERDAQFSPDGRWVAYASDESGRFEIYVRPFAPPSPLASADKALGATGTTPAVADGQWQVSTAGGTYARWRTDGQALYYLAPDGTVMAASIAAKATTFEPGTPAALFRPRIVNGGSVVFERRHQYDVAPDGRFLINTELDSAAAPITLLTNWNPEAKK